MFEKRKRIIIAGAPRCGTTSLFRYLNDHPDIYGPQVKETCYFLDKGYFPPSYNQSQLLTNFHDEGYNGYDDLFKEATKNQVLLDATPDYMYQETFLKILSDFTPKPIVVFCLRKPSKRIFSMYKYAQSRLGILDNKISFSEYIKMVYSKSPLLKEHNVLNNSIEQSKYDQYINKVAEIIGKNAVIVFSFEAFVKEPQKYMNLILDKVEVDTSYFNNYDFKKYNESYEVKTQAIRKLYEALPLPSSFRYGDSKLKNTFKKLHEKFNAKPNSKNTDEEHNLLQKLDNEEFLTSTKFLAEKYKVDISAW